MKEYKPTIGLEIHAELLTKTKMFCDCLNDPLELTPNTNACPICMGHPGTLPVPNQGAIDAVLTTGMALGCEISIFSKFDRKNYFYPDLPKAYQISQYDLPLCKEGKLTLPDSKKEIRITRIHLEEDTAKLSHAGDGRHSLVDFNRAGVPLMELVTEPDFSSPQEVVSFAREFQLLLRYLGVSEADMERGNLRLEANISVAPVDAKELGTKVEVKNLNSFRSLEKACEYEIERQTNVLQEKKKIMQETRGWDEETQKTFSQRSKESAHDYRYFPEPDIPPLRFSDEYFDFIRARMSETPWDRRARFSAEYNLSATQAHTLVEAMSLASFFEEAVSELRSLNPSAPLDLLVNYLTSDVRGLETQTKMLISESQLKPAHLAKVVYLVAGGEISSRVAKDVLAKVFETGQDPEDIVKEGGLSQVSDEKALEETAAVIIDNNAQVWYDYTEGKESALQFLIGQVMKETKGAANPQVVARIFQRRKDEVH